MIIMVFLTEFKMKLKQIILFLITCFFVVNLIVIVNRIYSPTNKSHDTFYYSPADTYCPIPIFSDEIRSNEIPSDECQYEFPDWLYVSNNHVIFNQSIWNQIGEFKCYFKQIKWVSDFKSSKDETWQLLFNNTYIGDRIISCLCKSKGLFNYNEQYLFGYEEKKGSKNSDAPDILIVGIDSVSRLAWQRLLTHSYEYIEKEMDQSSVIFKKVNVRGDGTTINVLAILTGEEESELYESRRNEPGAKHVDDYPWIWKQLSKENYVTFYDDEDIDFGTFEYRLLGFKHQPTDYYGRTWRLAHQMKKRSKPCMNQRNNFQFQLDSAEQFFQSMKQPKFNFIWSSFFSHDFNDDVMKIDNNLLGLLKKINDPSSVFNNTIFFLISDHGHRFNSRLHLQGKYEERLPFMAVNVPRSIRNKYPHLVKNMKSNENKLVTLFDAHETLIDVVNQFTVDKKQKNSSEIEKMSLFDSSIPNRNCQNVKVPAHWCVCLKWLDIDSKNQDVIDSARYAVEVINRNTEEYRSVCYKLELNTVIRAHLIAPSEDVVKFYQSDKDGRKPYLTDDTVVDGIYYRVVFQTTPGDAVFESTINVKKINNKPIYHVNIDEIDRNNRYSKWISCITNQMRDVRKYCLCH